MAAANTSYPKNLSSVVRRLRAFTKNTYKLSPAGSVTAGPSNIVIIDLPPNALVDLSTLSLWFRATTTTTAGFAVPPRNIELLIDRVDIECNGVALQSSPTNLNQLFNILSDLQHGEDCTSRRKVMQNSLGSTAAPSANITDVPFCVQSWVGFLGSTQVIDTAAIGNVRIRITLAPATVLTKSSTAATPSYSLSDIHATVDTMAIADGVFDALMAQYLQGGGVIEIPFKNWTCYSSACNGLTQTTRWNLSSQSVNRALACFVLQQEYPAGADNGSNRDTLTNNNMLFSRLGAGTVSYGTTANSTPQTYAITSWNFTANGVPYPSFRPTASHAFPLLLNAINVSQDTLGGVNPLLNSVTTFGQSFFTMGHEFEHGDPLYTSGLDTRGAAINGTFETVGTITQGTNVGTGASQQPGNALMCLVFVESTSSLRYTAGKQIEVVA